MSVSAQWLEKYEAIKESLRCRTDLDSYFTQEQIKGVRLGKVDLGMVRFPSGKVIACDPFIELEDAQPFIQSIEPGSYKVDLCIALYEQWGNRCACARLLVSDEKPVRYEMAMTGQENLDEEFDPDENAIFGFGVDAGMACIADAGVQPAFSAWWGKRLEEDESIDPYNDLFCDLLEESVRNMPQYQTEGGDWVKWEVPDSDCDLPVFASGFGDGYYAVYFGYDACGKVCAVYVHFIDLYEDDDEDSDD